MVAQATLEVAAHPACLRAVRVAAAALAADVVDDAARLDDVRLAVDEVCAALLQNAAPDERLHLEMQTDHDGLTVDVCIGSDGRLPVLSPISELLLDTVCDDYRITTSRTTTHASLRISAAPGASGRPSSPAP